MLGGEERREGWWKGGGWRAQVFGAACRGTGRQSGVVDMTETTPAASPLRSSPLSDVPPPFLPILPFTAPTQPDVLSSPFPLSTLLPVVTVRYSRYLRNVA